MEQKKIELKPFVVTKVVTTKLIVIAKDTVSAKELAEDEINIAEIEESSSTTVVRKEVD
ncbi:hypothetical protein AB1K09_20285 [Solibacillus silvestris]